MRLPDYATYLPGNGIRVSIIIIILMVGMVLPLSGLGPNPIIGNAIAATTHIDDDYADGTNPFDGGSIVEGGYQGDYYHETGGDATRDDVSFPSNDFKMTSLIQSSNGLIRLQNADQSEWISMTYNTFGGDSTLHYDGVSDSDDQSIDFSSTDGQSGWAKLTIWTNESSVNANLDVLNSPYNDTVQMSKTQNFTTSGIFVQSLCSSCTFRTDNITTQSYSALQYPTVTGKVSEQDGEPVGNATVQAINQDGDLVGSDETDNLGDYSLSLANGTYDISASAENYSTVNKTITVSGEDQTVDFQLTEFDQSITLDSRMYMEYGQSSPYDVVVTVEGDRRGVTEEATVTSGNSSVVTIDDSDQEVVATNDTSVNNRTYVQAEWTDDEGNTYTTRRNVTVANATVENIQILPDFTRFTASLSDETVMVIIIATGVGAAATLFATSFAGVSAVTMVMLLGWLAGYVNNGMAILAVLMAMFVGMNVAGNVDYTVRR